MQGCRSNDLGMKAFSGNTNCVHINHKELPAFTSKRKHGLCPSIQLPIVFQAKVLEFAQHSHEQRGTVSDCCAPAWSVCCCRCPAVRSYATLLKALRVLLLPTVLTITSFQLVHQLLCHPAVIHLPHMSSPVNLNFIEPDFRAHVPGSCCC